MTPAELDNLAHMRRARDFMDREFASAICVEDIARRALMSAAHFSRLFRAAYGETPYTYLMTRRVERAKALLRAGEMSVTDVCMAVGFSSLGTFSTRFTQIVGESPRTYARRDHEALASLSSCVARHATRPRRQGSRIEEVRLFAAP